MKKKSRLKLVESLFYFYKQPTKHTSITKGKHAYIQMSVIQERAKGYGGGMGWGGQPYWPCK